MTTTASAEAVRSRLKTFEGFWIFTGRLDGAEFGIQGPNTHTERCEMIGDQFVVSRYDVNLTRSPYHGLGIVGYDDHRQAFTFTSYDSRGVITNLHAPVEDGRWVWSPDGNEDVRVVWEPSTADSYAFRVESRQPSGEWQVISDGRYDRVCLR